MLLALAWRNLWRQPVRTGLTLVSIVLASGILVFMLSFQLGVYAQMKANALRLFDGFAQIQPPGYAADPEVKKTIADPEAAMKAALSTPGITAATPRATSFAILSNGDLSYGGAVVGIDPAREKTVTTLTTMLKQGKPLSGPDAAEILLGDALARNLHLSVGQKVTLLGEAADGSIAADSVTVVGIFHSGIPTLDRQMSLMPIGRFRASWALPGGANIIALSGPSLPGVTAALPALRRKLAGTGLTVADWGTLQPALRKGIALDFSTGLLWYVILVVMVVFILLNTLLMSVLERTREFGMLLAVGMRARQIGGMLWLEFLLMALAGNLGGILIGGAIAVYYANVGIAFSGLEGVMAQWGLPGRLFPELTPVSVLAGPVVITASIALSAVIPMRRVARLEPVSAMQAV